MGKRLNAREFVTEWMTAIREGKSLSELAASLDLSPTTLHIRRKRLIDRGVKLPLLKGAYDKLDEAEVEELNKLI